MIDGIVCNNNKISRLYRVFITGTGSTITAFTGNERFTLYGVGFLSSVVKNSDCPIISLSAYNTSLVLLVNLK
jgi:hypothetical protein